MVVKSFSETMQQEFGTVASIRTTEKVRKGSFPFISAAKVRKDFLLCILLAYFLTMIFYDFKRYLRALLKPSAMTAPSFTNSDKYCLVREGCKPIACAI